MKLAMTQMLVGAITAAVAMTGIVWALRHEGGLLSRAKAMFFTLLGIAAPVAVMAVAPALAHDNDLRRGAISSKRHDAAALATRRRHIPIRKPPTQRRPTVPIQEVRKLRPIY